MNWGPPLSPRHGMPITENSTVKTSPCFPRRECRPHGHRCGALLEPSKPYGFRGEHVRVLAPGLRRHGRSLRELLEHGRIGPRGMRPHAPNQFRSVHHVPLVNSVRRDDGRYHSHADYKSDLCSSERRFIGHLTPKVGRYTAAVATYARAEQIVIEKDSARLGQPTVSSFVFTQAGEPAQHPDHGYSVSQAHHDEAIADHMLTLLAERDTRASVCPSEVARSIAPASWRAIMPRVRAVAAELALAGEVRITQGSQQIDPAAVIDGTVRGPLRLRLTRIAPMRTNCSARR